MEIKVRRIDDAYRFESSGDRSGTFIMDSGKGSGGKGEYLSPLQTMLGTMGGCSGIDVVSILEKSRQSIDNMEINLHADRVKKGFISPFEHVHVQFVLDGQIDEDKAVRAIRLSLEKYCTVSHHLSASIRITASLILNGKPKREIELEMN